MCIYFVGCSLAVQKIPGGFLQAIHHLLLSGGDGLAKPLDTSEIDHGLGSLGPLMVIR